MTVVELLGALVQPALLPAPPAVSDAIGSTGATAVVYDSRRAVPGAVFVALRGQKDDGARFAPQAVARGAVLVVAETPAPATHQGAWVVVPDARLALAVLADRFHQHPSGALRVVGITGTNGKTTTAYLLRSILEAAGERCGLLGTVVYSVGREDREATSTTPEAPDMQQMLHEMVDNGCAAAVMEVSSHALALKRVDGVQFAAGVFSNLTRDHLDFHGDMETYFAAKRRLFEMLPDGAPAVVNVDDPQGAAAGGERAAAGHLRHAHRRGCDPGAVRLRVDGPAVHRPHAARRSAREVDAGGPAQRLQPAGGHRDRRRIGCAARGHRVGHRATAGGARTLRSGLAARRRHRRRRRLRAYRRRAQEPARDRARAVGRAG